MDRLPPQARALLERARDAHDPTPSRRASADAAARAELTRRGIHDLPQLNAADRARSEPGVQRFLPGISRAATLLRLALATFAAVASLGALVLFGSRGERERSEPASARAAVNEASRVPQDRPPAPSATLQPVQRALAVAPARLSRSERPRARYASDSIDSAARATGDAGSLAAELRFIATVDAHVRAHDFAAALRLLASPASAGSRDQLREERRALRVLALCGSGPREQALREREQFLRTAPKSLLAARVRAACAGKPP